MCKNLKDVSFPPVGVISTEVTYLLGGLVFAWIVEEWVWDYAITVTLLHIGMTVAGNDDAHARACKRTFTQVQSGSMQQQNS